jgi:hypothetical protein
MARPGLALFCAATCAALLGCGGGGGSAGGGPSPSGAVLFGVNLDWSADSPAAFNARLGHKAAVYVRFFGFPLSPAELQDLDATMTAVATESGRVMITLEPFAGLDQVTPQAASDFASVLAGYDASDVPIFVRFGHEMNGSWYPWSQQPVAYVDAFRTLADAVHDQAPDAAMVWAPNYGGGYPFSGGAYESDPGQPDFALLDSSGDGILTMADDPYEPYYPGDDAVDWVGMSLYHWGSAYPWGENEIPETGKFIAQLTGTYSGLNGDDTAVPDFYSVYSTGHGKPVAIAETAALYNTAAAAGPGELAIKQAWWRQVFDRAMLQAYPGIRMINWFEHLKPESEVGGADVDWRVLGSDAIGDPFRAELPVDLLEFAG